MIGTQQILFIEGGVRAGAQYEWDETLVESLRRELGIGTRSATRGCPTRVIRGATWSAAVRDELAGLHRGASGGPLGGRHDPGQLLTEQRPERERAAVVLIAAPFVSAGGGASDEFELSSALGAGLPQGLRVQLFHGTRGPGCPALAGRPVWARDPTLRLLPGRDHQLNNDMSDRSAEGRQR